MIITEKQHKEAPNSIELGSVDKLAVLAIPELNKRGLKLTTLEGPTLGEIISSLTIVGSTSVMAKGEIYPKFDSFHSIIYDMQTMYGLDRNQPNAAIQALSFFANADRKEDIALITSGSFFSGDHTVHIGLNSGNKLGNNLRSIAINENDLIQTGIQESSPSIQKQFIADLALRLLLDELGIENKNIPFEPRKIEKKLLDKEKSVLNNLKRLLKNSGYKIAFVESAPGGFLTNRLTDIKGGEGVLHSGKILYNSKEKIRAGIPHYSLRKDKLYSKITAFKLAETVFVRRTENNTFEFDNNVLTSVIAIGVTGLLDTPDTREEFKDKKSGGVYYSIIIPGHEPITKKVTLSIQSRQEMKMDLTLKIFNHLIQILEEGE